MFLRCRIIRPLISLLLCIVLVCAGRNVSSQAADNTDIRVILEALYKNKSSIMIYNSDIALGFCIDNVYEPETELYSATGFGFNPDKGTYYADSSEYPSYSECADFCVKYF